MKTGASDIISQTVLTVTDIVGTLLTHVGPEITVFPNSFEELFGAKVASMVMRFKKLSTSLFVRADSISALLNESGDFFLRMRENESR